jgi:hypothetical protein
MSISDGLVVVTMSPSQSWRLGFGQIRITTTAKKKHPRFLEDMGFQRSVIIKRFHSVLCKWNIAKLCVLSQCATEVTCRGLQQMYQARAMVTI